MADVRTLLQREREARRIQHSHLSYSKSGALTCIVCNLNVRSEALWEGHLKSANHRKNLRDAASSTAGAGNGKKRRIEEVIKESNPRKRKGGDEEEGEVRKKRQVSFQVDEEQDVLIEGGQTVQQPEADIPPAFIRPEATAVAPQATPTPTPSPPPTSTIAPPINEDEWDAFSAEIAPLISNQDYSAATISAAPVSAAELAAEDRRSRRELEAEDEKEENEQRLVEEFEVMEEMEERVRRLKEKREALRTMRPIEEVTVAPAQEALVDQAREPPALPEPPESESDGEEDVDDWFS